MLPPTWQYLQKALALEEAGGPVQNSSSTHLNICAALSALKRPKEVRRHRRRRRSDCFVPLLPACRLAHARLQTVCSPVHRCTSRPTAASSRSPCLACCPQALAHAERAIILLQRHLWPPGLAFQEGLAALVRSLAAPSPAARQALGAANVLAMAYHNAAVEHEKLGRLREALVSFTRCALRMLCTLRWAALGRAALGRARGVPTRRAGRRSSARPLATRITAFHRTRLTGCASVASRAPPAGPT